ncbi:endopolyphosphatase [Histoplasma ohiense]|nr:endopolyphosphatase [Histoplasma ohiense (nom. inval.)]
MVKLVLALLLLASRPLWTSAGDDAQEAKDGKLHGRFLHITDIHVDPNYKPNSNADGDHDCHRGSGHAGFFGAVGSDCDSPLTLVNATVAWIQDNLADSIDFVIWTGDAARHDSDEKIPRTEKEVLQLNQLLASKFHDIVSTSNGKKKEMRIPFVLTIGNNDVMPHNILKKGPNTWTKNFASIWDPFIPEEQHHSFVHGGWFYVEVIPHRLAVFSLNTMYFFSSNSAVDGCASEDEPGYEHMEWLRVQLQFIRKRDMKAILIGHVPPARTDSKENWDETCWQKYTLWLQQYRDIIVGSMFGHMNIDHFMLQDTKDIKIGDGGTKSLLRLAKRDSSDDQTVSIQSRMNYLTSLRDSWARLPSPPDTSSSACSEGGVDSKLNHKSHLGLVWGLKPQGKKKDMRKYLKAIGGPWAERFSISLVSPSVIPDYYPTLRVIEYNVSGLENAKIWSEATSHHKKWQQPTLPLLEDVDIGTQDLQEESRKKKKKKPKMPKFESPEPPSTTSPPGPAYSNQPLTLLSYTQYFANLTELNNIQTMSYTAGRDHNQKLLKHDPRESDDGLQPRKFSFEVFYDTKTDKVYNLKDLTVKSFLNLARGIAEKKKASGGRRTEADLAPGYLDGKAKTPPEEKGNESPVNLNQGPSLNYLCTGMEASPPMTPSRDSLWSVFVRRAFVGFVDDNA